MLDEKKNEAGMFWFIFIASIYLTTLVLVSPFQKKAATPERRVALVIGNAKYKWTKWLNNPGKDAADMADALASLGFEVIKEHDLGIVRMRRVIEDFEDKSRGADWALVYYAGHGMELSGKNWLIPVDAEFADGLDDLPAEAISVKNVLGHLSGAKKLRILILDACRDCPLRARILMNKGFIQVHSHGLARMTPAYGEIVFFAARHGTKVNDGKKGENSPFVKALLEYLAKEGLELGQFFRRVTSNVLEATKNKPDPQEPFVYGHIPDEDFYFKPSRLTH